MKEKNYHRFESILLYLLDTTTLRILPTWPQLFKRWITVSTRQISIQWIAQLIPNTYLLNSDLSLGWRYPAFVQPAPVLSFYLLLT